MGVLFFQVFMNTFKKGKTGEKSAENYLIGKGYSLIARNFKAHLGEVDLIMVDGADLVFIEVKAWKSLSFADLEYSINRVKQHRIIATSQIFMLQNPVLCKDKGVRYDVVHIDGEGNITHLKDAIGEY